MRGIEYDIPLMEMGNSPEDVQDSLNGFRRDLDRYIAQANERGDIHRGALLRKAADDIDAKRVTPTNFKETLKAVSYEFDEHLQSVGIEPVFEEIKSPNFNDKTEKTYGPNNDPF